ncbi:MAG: DmsE family decaheme c-type cytochrome [Ideonella sp.]
MQTARSSTFDRARSAARRFAGALLLLAAVALPQQAAAQVQPAASAKAPVPAASLVGKYTEKGADTCLECHGEDDGNYKVGAMFKGRHGHRGDARAPFGPRGLQCEACHGPGAAHARNQKATSINTFKTDSSMPLEARNATCLSCHQGGMRTAWHAGAHERSQVACTDCHTLHAERDAVLTKAGEPTVCYTCHKQQRADFQKTSAHPVRSGLMACSDCHNAHGSPVAAMLKQPTVNQTCFTCHADKRGPLLWEHAPVAEDCGLCHAPHGAIRPALLSKSPPLLCQECHSAAGHPSVARTGAALPSGGGTGAIFTIAGSCTNCHTQVHGSNHPAGAKLMR